MNKTKKKEEKKVFRFKKIEITPKMNISIKEFCSKKENINLKFAFFTFIREIIVISFLKL